MKNNTEKPSPEAKALSLFLMAYKSTNPIYKEKLKRINRLWDLVKADEMSKTEYMEEVQEMLASYGGYADVLEKTVKYYIDTTGAWKSQGNDQYSQDAKQVAARLLKKK